MKVDNATVTWIAETRDAVALARDQREVNRQMAGLEDARAELQRLLVEFRPLSDAASVARTFGWPGWIPNAEIRRDFSQAAEDLDPRPLTRLRTALAGARPEITSSLVEAWGAHARRRLGDVEELLVLADTLSVVEGLADLSRRLKASLVSLAATQRRVPSAASLETLRQAEAVLAEWEEALPAEVRRFLSSVVHGGASIEQLTEEVTAWLRLHHAVGRFRIVAGSPEGHPSD